MQNNEHVQPENENKFENSLDNQEPMEKDDIVNPEQFQVSRSGEPDQEDDSKYTPEENQFADGKGTELAEEFDAPDPEEFEDEEPEVLDDDVEIDDNKDLNNDIN